ncbi:MAG: ATP-dependent helicase [Pyrinomonadaceae bacterium]
MDEYQDTNKLQSEIIDLLGVHHRNVMVVGDDAQSIYAWRGAEWSNIYEFPQRYPEARVFRLETNYRSTPEILAVANVSIASNRKQFPKTLRAHRPSLGLQPALVPCRDADQQAVFLAARILELRDEGIRSKKSRCFIARIIIRWRRSWSSRAEASLTAYAAACASSSKRTSKM